MQVQLNFAAVVETLVSPGPGRYRGEGARRGERRSKRTTNNNSRSLHCHTSRSTFSVSLYHCVPPGTFVVRSSLAIRRPRRETGPARTTSSSWEPGLASATRLAGSRVNGITRVFRDQGRHTRMNAARTAFNVPSRTIVLGVCTHDPTPGADPRIPSRQRSPSAAVEMRKERGGQ